MIRVQRKGGLNRLSRLVQFPFGQETLSLADESLETRGNGLLPLEVFRWMRIHISPFMTSVSELCLGLTQIPKDIPDD